MHIVSVVKYGFLDRYLDKHQCLCTEICCVFLKLSLYFTKFPNCVFPCKLQSELMQYFTDCCIHGSRSWFCSSMWGQSHPIVPKFIHLHWENEIKYLLLYFKKVLFCLLCPGSLLVLFTSSHSITNLIKKNLQCDKILEAVDVLRQRSFLVS